MRSDRTGTASRRRGRHDPGKMRGNGPAHRGWDAIRGPASRETPGRRGSVLLVGLVFLAVLGVDASTKLWAAAALAEPVFLNRWFGLALHYNHGSFLGTLPMPAGTWAASCAAAVWFGWRAVHAARVSFAICVAVVLAGVVGNALDAAQGGGVIDFIAVRVTTHGLWTVWNVADLAMLGGLVALAVLRLRKKAPGVAAIRDPKGRLAS